jgi:DNA-binding MarR family transcriptional regulator
MIGELDLDTLLGNTSLLLPRTNRRLTRLFDCRLNSVGLTSTQFGLLANLAGMSATGRDAPRIGVFAERMGVGPTTLYRNLKPLVAARLVALTAGPTDKRVRTVHITEAGRARLVEALPRWRKAQDLLDETIGTEARLALNALLELADERLTAGTRPGARPA